MADHNIPQGDQVVKENPEEKHRSYLRGLNKKELFEVAITQHHRIERLKATNVEIAKQLVKAQSDFDDQVIKTQRLKEEVRAVTDANFALFRSNMDKTSQARKERDEFEQLALQREALNETYVETLLRIQSIAHQLGIAAGTAVGDSTTVQHVDAMYNALRDLEGECCRKGCAPEAAPDLPENPKVRIRIFVPDGTDVG